MEQKDLYKILEVTENASVQEIKKKYRRLAKKYHPDKNRGNQQAEARFKDISQAADILTDPKKREQYDQMRKYSASGFGGGFDPQHFSGGRSSFDFGKSGGFSGFEDIFATIFGDGFGAEPRSGNIPRRGKDIHGSISVNFTEAIKGTTKTITISGPQSCPTCQGTGAEQSTKTTTCPECGGSGQLSLAQGAFSIKRTCPRCLGRGRIIGQSCQICRGTGNTKQKRKLAVKIPPGVENNGQIRLRGQGTPGSGGAGAGDLIFTIQVGQNQHFEREGKNIHTNATINLAQAVLGSKIKVRTLTGQVSLKIPPGTKNGAVLRLKNLGLQLNGDNGDQYVKIDVLMPDDLKPEEKELIEQLAQSRGWEI